MKSIQSARVVTHIATRTLYDMLISIADCLPHSKKAFKKYILYIWPRIIYNWSCASIFGLAINYKEKLINFFFFLACKGDCAIYILVTAVINCAIMQRSTQMANRCNASVNSAGHFLYNKRTWLLFIYI